LTKSFRKKIQRLNIKWLYVTAVLFGVAIFYNVISFLFEIIIVRIFLQDEIYTPDLIFTVISTIVMVPFLMFVLEVIKGRKS
jgi:hypothetical protein